MTRFLSGGLIFTHHLLRFLRFVFDVFDLAKELLDGFLGLLQRLKEETKDLRWPKQHSGSIFLQLAVSSMFSVKQQPEVHWLELSLCWAGFIAFKLGE